MHRQIKEPPAIAPRVLASLWRIPILITTTFIVMMTIYVGLVQLSEHTPISPWEASNAMEAMRLNAGLPLYESAHATHMYGPLLTVALALIFRVAGLDLSIARMTMSIFALTLCALLAFVFCPSQSRAQQLWALLLFFGINFRTNLVFFSTQPDCLAALFAIAGLYLWITCGCSSMRFAFAIVFFLCATFTKQTAAAFALIPIVHLLIWKWPIQRRDFLSSLIPLMSILLALLGVRLIWPQLFIAMVSVPASIRVHPARVLNFAVYLIATFPLLFVALSSLLLSKDGIGKHERWICSSSLVLIPVSLWVAGKSGGSYNSLLFAYLAMTALVATQLDAISNWIRTLSRWRGFVAACVFGTAMAYSFFFQFEKTLRLLSVRSGDEKYESAIVTARKLGAGVISPQDPTIAYRANGYFGRSLFFELDAHAMNGNWPGDLPQSTRMELERANYLIEVRTYVPTPSLEPALAANRFHPISIPELAGSVYTAWAKSSD